MSKKFAVFDIDGTLIRWQLYHTIVDKLAKEESLGTDAHQKLREARMVWKRREHPEAFKDYENILIEVYESALEILPPQSFDAMVQRVIEEYKDQVYTYTRDLIKKLHGDGYFLLAISGSHHELVREIAHHYDFDDFVGTTYERTDQKFSGKKFVASHDKKQVLEQLVQKHQLTFKDSYAVGDSLSDAVMLEMVENPLAFNPDERLFTVAREHQWKIVVERKNVIYELEAKNGHYILAETN